LTVSGYSLSDSGGAKENRSTPQWQVWIPSGPARLVGDLSIPEACLGLVIFAHGSGSGRRSPRNRFVGQALERNGIATLLLDLLTPTEAEEDEQTLRFRFNIPLLGDRLVASVDWAGTDARVRRFPLGLYGASTGGAAALIAAAARPTSVKALVLRGARSDLADPYAGRVTAPTLFVVGGHDSEILSMNRETARGLNGPSETTIVPGATHLFEEAGALQAVTECTVAWFRKHLPERPAATTR
jgi:putative phosphoribosyl transferase